MAVIALVRIQPMIHAWRAERSDGVVALVTFALTLIMAPHLDKGILVGVGLSLIMFLLRTMRPRFAVLSRFNDGTMRDVAVKHLPTSSKISVIRFDGSLYFANAGYFETRILGVVADNPELEILIIDAEGINELDATGEEVLHHLVERLRAQGILVLIARMKKQFMDTASRTGLDAVIGQDHFFSRIDHALTHAWDTLGDRYDRSCCPLRHPASTAAG
jgi:SulP family sulfate permease